MPDLNPPSESPTQPGLGPRRFECELRSSDRAAAWIRVSGDLDLGSAPQLEQALRDALPSALLLIIDLRQLTGIDSTGLHVLLEADARARRGRRRLVFIRGAAQIDRLFELFGLSDRLEIVDLKPVLVGTR